MARLSSDEVKRFLPSIAKALEGVVFGRVTIDVRHGHIEKVHRAKGRLFVNGGRPLDEMPAVEEDAEEEDVED